MKIYGNAKSDGFALLMAVIGALFFAGAWAMVNLSGFALVGGLLLFGLLIALMLVRVQRWSVMSEHVEPAEHATFPVAADSDLAAVTVKAAWSSASEASLPAPIENPKPAVETNAIV